MSKKETIHNGYELTIYRTVKKERISDKTEFTVSNCNNNPEVHDEMVFTESQWAELKEFFRKDFDGIIWKPFSAYEIEKEFPDLIDLGRSIWHSAFEYVNQKLRQR